jgi:hypothetical protein
MSEDAGAAQSADPSVAGGLAEAAQAGWNAAGDFGSGLLHTAEGVGQFGAAVGDHLLATGAELVGAQDTRDQLDNAAVDHREQAYSDFKQAGDDAANFSHDLLGGGNAHGGGTASADDGTSADDATASADATGSDSYADNSGGDDYSQSPDYADGGDYAG